MYTYFKPINHKEHMLYASEVAQISKVFSVNDKPATRFISALLTDYIKRNNLEDSQLYYSTAKGLAKVYPESIYRPVLMELGRYVAENYRELLDKDPIMKYKIGNTEYKFRCR